MENKNNTNASENTTTKIYTAYSASCDMTFIVKDKITENGDVQSTEVVGFYFGAPNLSDTLKYTGKLKAQF